MQSRLETLKTADFKRIRARNCPIQKGFRWFKATGTDSKAKDQHEAEIRATKQAHTATEAKIRTEPPKPQENRLERKSAQSSPIVQDTSISDKNCCSSFETKVRALAEKSTIRN